MQSSRGSDRRLVSLPATVTVAGKKMRDVVTNVSPSGIYLEADRHRFRPGERIRVAFSLPISGKLVPVTVDGRVARVVRDTLHRTKGIGVELISPPPNVTETIETYLAVRDATLAGRGGKSGREEAERPLNLSEEDERPFNLGATVTGGGSEDARLAAEPTAEYHLDQDEPEDDELTDPTGESPF